MSSDPRIDQLLDEWEKLRESDSQLTPSQFIKRHIGREDNEVIRQFQRKAEKLASFDRVMQQVAGPLSTGDQIPDWGDGDLRLSDLRPGFEPIPNYRLVSRLGSGGFGEVWKSESPGGFHVALKFVQLGGRAAEIEERSLDVVKNVRHPHLLSVFGTWRIGEQLIIATELADCTLLDRLHQAQREGHEGIPLRELLRYFVEAAKGIDALNDPGDSGRMRIQHRDIKPQNLLISGGSVKVGDYGLARSVQTDATGHSGGLTFAYAAPECFAGTTSRRSDQYSLAITYCQLRGGRFPFEGSPIDLMMGHRKREPDLSMLSAVERPAVARALSKQPRDRWSSCRKFIGALVRATEVLRHPERATVPPLSAETVRLSNSGVLRSDKNDSVLALVQIHDETATEYRPLSWRLSAAIRNHPWICTCSAIVVLASWLSSGSLSVMLAFAITAGLTATTVFFTDPRTAIIFVSAEQAPPSPRRDAAQLQAEKQRIVGARNWSNALSMLFVVVGFVLLLVPTAPGEEPQLSFLKTFSGMVLFGVAGSLLAKYRGRHPAWGLMSFASLLLLVCLPDRHQRRIAQINAALGLHEARLPFLRAAIMPLVYPVAPIAFFLAMRDRSDAVLHNQRTGLFTLAAIWAGIWSLMLVAMLISLGIFAP